MIPASTFQTIHDILIKHEISYGIVEEKSLAIWLKKPFVKDDTILIADGIPPRDGQNGFNIL